MANGGNESISLQALQASPFQDSQRSRSSQEATISVPMDSVCIPTPQRQLPQLPTRLVRRKNLKTTNKDKDIKDVCPICTAQVKDNQDAIMCDGKCNLWYHRWCASVPKKCYSELANSSELFLCPNCKFSRQDEEIHALQAEIKALKVEMAWLKDQVKCTKAPVATQTYAKVAAPRKQFPIDRKRQQKLPDKQKKPAWKAIPDLARQATAAQNSLNPNSSPSSSRRNARSDRFMRASEKVNGLRKIWGTMRTTSTAVVTTTVARLLPSVAGKLQVRRKFKSLPNGRTIRWWFLVRGDEVILQDLQKSWNAIQLHTSWKLEECVKFIDDTHSRTREKGRNTLETNAEDPIYESQSQTKSVGLPLEETTSSNNL